MYDRLLVFFTAASHIRRRITASVVIGGIVRWRNVARNSLALRGQNRLGGNLLPLRRDEPLALRLREALPRSSVLVRLSTARLPRRDPPLCTLIPGDWFLIF